MRQELGGEIPFRKEPGGWFDPPGFSDFLSVGVGFLGGIWVLELGRPKP